MKKRVLFILLIALYSCQPPAVREPEYEEVIEEPISEEEQSIDSLSPTIVLFGTFYHTVRDSDTLYIPNGRISLIDEGFSHEVEYDAFGYYELTMLFGRNYSIRYSAPDFYTKFLEIDTRNIPDSIYGAGILMPTDMKLGKAENAELEELLESNPIGKAYYMKEQNDLTWDMAHTDSMKQVIEKLKQ